VRSLTVLGSCGAWPEANRACSGFLIDYDGFRVVIDLGFGAASRLLAVCPGGSVDAVVITHEHPDHCVDLNALFRARFYALPRPGLIPLCCTPGVLKRLSAIEPSPGLTEVFAIHDLPGSYEIGPLHIMGIPLPHHVPNAGVRITAPGLTLAYTGDTGPTPALIDLGRDADLFIVEATLRGKPADPPYLTTAREAGRWAALAGAKQLLLTHFWPGSDRSGYVADAREEFAGEVFAAEEAMVLSLDRRGDPHEPT
jgi:ribonuclease BN (tRNA processing enzyme)